MYFWVRFQLELGGKQVRMNEEIVDSANIADCNSMSPCESAPCKNGGQCTDLGNSSFSCACAEGFSGLLCGEEETLCQLLEPCLNGGTCTGNTLEYTCHCPWSYAGIHCNKSKSYNLFLI